MNWKRERKEYTERYRDRLKNRDKPRETWANRERERDMDTGNDRMGLPDIYIGRQRERVT